MENKKTKLTISGSSKKSYKNLTPSKSQGKKTVIIEKHLSRPSVKTGIGKSSGFRSSQHKNKQGLNIKTNFASKTPPAGADFERRKLAEQRATKRLKGDSDNDKKIKLGTKKKRVKTHCF